MAKKAKGGADEEAMRAALLAWYARHKRDLAWRRDRDPYRVWVSEIMLQQTRVAAVEEHYRSFLDAFPTVEALAAASEEEVLARWSGLGYYRRARMLHRAAKQVVRELGSVIPRAAEPLRALAGVGRYTAAAIASIAFGEPVAVVDGNVERVLARLDGAARPVPAAWHRAQQLLDASAPGDWNQAMMELGATLCTPQNPQCGACPVGAWCRAPGMATAKPRAERRRVQSWYALVEGRRGVYVVRRPAGAARMPGLWELPESRPHPAKNGNPDGDAVLCTVRHSITDTDYQVRVVRRRLCELAGADGRKGRWVAAEELFSLPLTGLARKILRQQGYGPSR